MLGLKLSDYDKLKIACEIEGHPDNVAPAIYGGIMISFYDDSHLDFVQFNEGLRALTWVAVVPDYPLETEKARALLPKEIDYKTAVRASATANVLVAALARQNWALAGKMMARDRWHQPYRKQLIHGFDTVEKAVMEEGALGLYLSGAGPTMIALFNEMNPSILQRLSNQLKEYNVEALTADENGVEAEQFHLQANGSTTQQ
ncbi:homoserine kinase [Halobacillus salinarum]|uniref:Homoserine kinase n=1 Tax=Halobacillus salinarum TaxID=2932257 RepID=A0ABY4ER75_9BACI|nr:homoserine kinase [Halobacillus salinarum]